MPNNDYILRGDALKAILGVSIYNTIEELEGARTIAENTWADGLYDAYKIIEEEVDAADVEPVRHGRWIPGDRFEYDGHGETVRHPGGITCSKCRYSFAEKYLWSRSYCPHCGAKMDAEPPKENPDDK
jgi:hypothetical protein